MILDQPTLPSEDWREADGFEPLTYEKVVGLNNLLSVAWLSRGLELAAAVARVVTRHGPGTGFLIRPDMLITNHHVLPTPEVAESSTAEFNYQTDWTGRLAPVRSYTLDATRYRSNAELDYAIIKLDGSPGDLFGYVNVLRLATPQVNDFVSIIQHPNGGLKQICFTDNKVSAVLGTLVQYSTDTEPGSSGAPVFTQDWHLVGVHHRGGGLAGPGGKKYFTNEGILLAPILADAADFLSLPDPVYDLAFGDLRGTLIDLITKDDSAAQLAAVATHVLQTRPQVAASLEEWAMLRAVRDEPQRSEAFAGLGVAIGAALRQWARSSGHESIERLADPALTPPPEIVSLCQPFNGSSDLPRDVYVRVLEALLIQLDLTRRIAEPPDVAGAAGAAVVFLRGVTVGAVAYGPVTT